MNTHVDPPAQRFMAQCLVAHRRALRSLGARSALAAALVAIAGCGQAQEYDAKPVLDDLVHIVMMPALTDVATRSGELEVAAVALAEDPTAARLKAAQDAWRAARSPWRSCDAFAFGPVVDQELSTAIDWWPAKPDAVEEKIAGTATLDAAYIDSVGASARGFMALEYLMFDSTNGDEAVLAALSSVDGGERRRAYLAAASENLASKAEALRLAWDEKGGKYALEVTLAGEGSKAFASQKAAVDELVNQLVFQADTVLNAKLGKPAGKKSGGEPLPDTEESPRSDNSIADMLATLRGIEAIYNGTYAGDDGLGISDLVRARNTAVDDRIQKALADAMAKVEAIPPPFRTAILEHPAEVDAAYESVRTLKRGLATEVVSVLGSTLRFNDADGD